MSDSENEEDIQNIDILGQEEAEFESEDNFEIREMTNNILEKNDFFIEKGNDKVMNEIIKFHEKLGFNDDELISEIGNCITNKILDISLVKLISEFASQTRSSEKIEILKSIYKFISGI